jgi:ribonuclease D
MADEQARKFVEDQLIKAGVKPSDDALLDYALCTVAMLAEINAKLHERLAAQRPKRKARISSTACQKR